VEDKRPTLALFNDQSLVSEISFNISPILICYLVTVVRFLFADRGSIWVNSIVGSTSVATKVHMLYLCIGGNSCCSIFYDSELHISFVRARCCGLRH
jgi:hypothetical protein